MDTTTSHTESVVREDLPAMAPAVATESPDATERAGHHPAPDAADHRDPGHLFRQILDTIPQSVYWKDLDSVFMGCNAAFAAELGLRPEEVVGKSDFDLADEGRARDFRASDRMVIDNDQPLLDFDLEHTDPAGRRKWEIVSKVPLHDRAGKVLGVLGTFRDVTEQKLAEEAMLASQRRYSAIFERSASGIAVVDPADGSWMRVNPALCDMLGYTEDELLAKTYKDLTHPDDLELNVELVERLLAGDTTRDRWEKRYLHKDGSVVWALVSAALIRSPQGEPLYFISQVQDITERKSAEQALRESDERMRILFKYAPDAYFLMDEKGNFVNGNLAAARLTGSERSEFYGQNLLEAGLLSEADTARAMRELAAVAQGQPSRAVEYRILRQDGSGVPVEVSSYPVSIQGKPVILCIARDISERKEAEREMAQMHQRLLEFSRQAGMAEVATTVLHNVGNVLNSINVSSSIVLDKVRDSRISGLSQAVGLLREHEDDLAGFFTHHPKGRPLIDFLDRLSGFLANEQREVVEETEFLISNIEHVKEIVSMQQSYAMVSGVSDLADLGELVEDALRMNVRALNRHGVEVVRDFGPAPEIEIEKYKVMQVLVNLIHNAKYACAESQQAERKLTLRIRSDEEQVRISVADNGIGIAPEKQEQIFNYGFTSRSAGRGLGLYSGLLCAQEMGGDLSVHSDGPGHGATFTLTLPVRQPENSHE